jgi:hypothetical protein
LDETDTSQLQQTTILPSDFTLIKSDLSKMNSLISTSNSSKTFSCDSLTASLKTELDQLSIFETTLDPSETLDLTNSILDLNATFPGVDLSQEPTLDSTDYLDMDFEVDDIEIDKFDVPPNLDQNSLDLANSTIDLRETFPGVDLCSEPIRPLERLNGGGRWGEVASGK